MLHVNRQSEAMYFSQRQYTTACCKKKDENYILLKFSKNK